MTSSEEVSSLVERAITMATPASGFVERRHRPESQHSWREPSPGAGLEAAMLVMHLAEQRAHKFALGLRGEGTSWKQLADLLKIEWQEGRSPEELAYERVLGPAPEGSRALYERNLYWHCRGAGGCGKYITDRGPYNGYPSDNEDGHAEDCRRHADERAAYTAYLEDQEERDRVSQEAMDQLPEGFGRETVQRAWKVRSRGGRYLGWSTTEILAVALALGDFDKLTEMGYTGDQAINRVFSGMAEPAEGRGKWLATLRAAATGVPG